MPSGPRDHYWSSSGLTLGQLPQFGTLILLVDLQCIVMHYTLQICGALDHEPCSSG